MFRAKLYIGIVASLLAVAQANATDAISYHITKSHFFKQTSASAPVSGRLTDFQPWHAAAMVVPTSASSVYNASVMVAGKSDTQEWMDRDAGNLVFSKGFMTQADMDGSVPNTAYTISMSTKSEGIRSCNLTISGGSYPSAPWITNYSATQAINPISDFTLKWTPFAGGTANDTIMVMVVDQSGNDIFHTPWLGQPGALNGTNRSAVIPAGKLTANKTYYAGVYFGKVVNRNTTSYPGVIGFAAFVAATEVQIQTSSPVPVANITRQPANQSGSIGGSATFSVAATSSGALSYQWRKDGIDLVGQTNSTLVLNNITPPQAGSYCVVVSNSGGSVTSTSATLTVIPSGPLPQITTQPVGARAIVGSTTTLSVTAVSSNGPVTYQWKTNTTPILGATNATYRITKAQLADSASYTVSVKNWGGSVESAPATVYIVNELTKPTLTITNAPPGGRVFTSSLRVGGKASDHSGIACVYWRLGNGPEALATGTTDWSCWAYLAPGTNVFRVRTIDLWGNETVATKTFFYVITAPITLHTTGSGSIAAPATNLEVGKVYSIKATPAPGNAFLNWSTPLYSTNPTMSFVMRQGLDFTANFVTNLMPNFQGIYNGMFYQPYNPTSQGSGLFTLKLLADGSFTLTVNMASGKYSTTGKFNPIGSAQVSIPRKGLTTLTAMLSLDLRGGTESIQGEIVDQTWSASLYGDRAVYSTKNPAPTAGKYTLAFPPSPLWGPAGTGYATVSIDPAGKVSVAGYLTEGTPISCGSSVSKYGHWPLLVPLPGNGVLLSCVAFTNYQTGNNLFTWINPVHSAYFQNGFTDQAQLTWSRFVTPTNAPVLKYSEALITWKGGNLPHPVTNWITLGTTGTIDLHGATNATVKLNLTSGTIQGTLWHPALNKSVPFNGVILKDEATATGYFLGTNQTGAFSLSPKAP